jgi:hypothetical protein
MPAPDQAQASLEHDVAEGRANVDATLDEIERRLSPGQLVDEVLRHGRGAGTDFVANLGRTLSANPIPTAWVGIGLLWLLLAPGQARSDRRTDTDSPPDGEHS